MMTVRVFIDVSDRCDEVIAVTVGAVEERRMYLFRDGNMGRC